MEVLHERCCGLDVHKNSVTACLLTSQEKQIKTYGTMTDDLLEMADWLSVNNGLKMIHFHRFKMYHFHRFKMYHPAVSILLSGYV